MVGTDFLPQNLLSMILCRGLLFAAHLQLIQGIQRIRHSISADSKQQPPDLVNFFDYSQHGEDWVHGSCSSRVRQSPIDFDDVRPPSEKLSYSYKVVKLEFDIANNGKYLSGNMAGKGVGGVTYDNAHYELMSINFHSLSEHTFRGMHTPVEIQLVHKHPTGDSLVTVAIPVESPTPITGYGGFLQRSNRSAALMQQNPVIEKIGKGPYMVPDENKPLFNYNIQAFLRSALPNPDEIVKAQVSDANSMDLNEMLEGGTFMEYAGSLTAPPCSEIVTWFVRREPIKASDEQILALHDELYRISTSKGNYRKTMPLRNRPITIRQAVQEKPEVIPPDPAIPIGPNPRLDNEARAMNWAQHSLSTAKAARDYVNDLDRRMQAAAIAHANALAPDLFPENPQAAGGTTPPPATPPPLDIAKQSEIIAKSIATAAKDAIFDAAQRISIEAREAAASAAKEATKMAKGHMPALPTADTAPDGEAESKAITWGMR